MFRFFRMRLITTAAKKVVSKLKCVRIFRSRSSVYVPFHEWEAKYLRELQCQTETGNLDSDMTGEESEEGSLIKFLRTSEGAKVQIHDVNQISPSWEINETYVGNTPVSAVHRIDRGYCINEGEEAGEQLNVGSLVAFVRLVLLSALVVFFTQ